MIISGSESIAALARNVARRIRFRISTLLWLTVVVSGGCGWWLDHWRLATPLFQARVELRRKTMAFESTAITRDRLAEILDEHQTRLQTMKKVVLGLEQQVEELQTTAGRE